MGTTFYSSDRPRFFAICISSVTGQPYMLNDLEQLQTQKRDDGSPGSFSFTCPLVQEYEIASRNYPNINPYVGIVAPMDLIALYAWRNTSPNNSGAGQVQSDPVSALQKAGTAFASLIYPLGDEGPAKVTALGLSTCLMIGMVDGAHESLGFTGARASFSINGSDLTKCFTINDITIPNTALGVGQSGFLGLATLQLSQEHSGSTFLLDALDALVRKDLSALSNLGNTVTFSQATLNAYRAFGYPWRNFVRVDGLDMSYKHLTSQNYPVYTPQAGAVWSSLLEIRNPPISRMFVSEIGQIIFDDSYHAWTEQTPMGTVGGEDIRDFETGFDDETLVTFISCMPRLSGGANAGILNIVGDFVVGSGFVNGISAASNAKVAQVARLGYRYAEFQSTYDLSYQDALFRQKYMLQVHNNIFTATLTVRGNACYRVGQRWTVLVQTGRKETTDATWYVESVTQEMQFGNDWTTVLALKYPTDGTLAATPDDPTATPAPYVQGTPL